MRILHPRSFPFILMAVGLGPVTVPAPIAAQEPPDTIARELERLRERIDSLEVVLRTLQEEGGQEEAEGALEELRAAARAAAGEAPPADTAPAFEGRQRSLQALNPEISVNADAFGHVHTDDVGRQNFILREVELSLQSALDPYSRARVFAGFHAAGPELVPFGEGHDHAGEDESEEGGHGGEFALEEAYVEWVGLPGSMGLKLGRFYQRFGALNRWHAHALPFQSRSLPHLAFIGEEPLGQTGLSATALLPVAGDAGTYEATVEVTRSSNELLFGASDRASILGHLNGFWQLSRSTDLDLGLSWIHGRYEDAEHAVDRNLFGAETSFTWRPPGQALYRSLVIRGGVMLLDGLVEEHDEDDEEPPEEEEEHGAERAVGAWSLAELRLSEQWLVGARFDWSENPLDPDQTAWLAGPTLTWWQSEWVRLRLEYDLLGRSFADDEGRLWLQVTFAMGPHKHETY